MRRGSTIGDFNGRVVFLRGQDIEAHHAFRGFLNGHARMVEDRLKDDRRPVEWVVGREGYA